MFWWRKTGEVLCGPDGQQEVRDMLVPIYAEGIDVDANIDYVEDGVRESEVLHLRDPLAGETLIYRRDPEQCGCLLNRFVTFDQWETASIILRFWARAANTPQLRVSFNILYTDTSTELITRDFTSFDPYGEWTKFTTVLSAATDLDGPVQSIDLSFELYPRAGQSDCDPPVCDEVWLDDLYLYDNLQWTQVGGEPTHVQIHPEGALFVNQEPFVPRILHDNAHLTSPTEIKQRYKEIGPGGGGDHGMEFNTVVAHSSFAWNYPTKRHLALMLAAANSWDMKLIAYLPVYPRFEPRVPTSNDLVEDWVSTFNEDPGLLGWIVADEITYHKITNVLDPQGPDAEPFLEAYEKGLEDPDSGQIEYFHPAFLFTADDAFADGESFGNGACLEPTGCLREMLDVCHILLPNIFPILNINDEPMEIMSAVAAWSRTAVDLYNDEKDWTGDTESSYRGTVGVIQFRPYRPTGTRPPSVGELKVMSLQHVANGSLGLMYYDNHFAYSGAPDDLWDVLDPDSRLVYDGRCDGAATAIYEQMPDVHAAVERVMERKQLNLPPHTASRHVLYLDGVDVEDTFVSTANQSHQYHDWDQMEVAQSCSENCNNISFLKFVDFHAKIPADDPDKIERAHLVLPIRKADDCSGNLSPCPLGLSQPLLFSRTMVMRIPGGSGIAASDTSVSWWQTMSYLNYRTTNVGYNKFEKWVLDIEYPQGVGWVRTFAANDPIIKSYAYHYSARVGISNMARFWATYNGSNNTRDLNNGLQLQGFPRTRYWERNVVFLTSEHSAPDPIGQGMRPHIVLYTTPEAVQHPSLDVPYYDEVNGGYVDTAPVRMNDPAGFELLAINNDDAAQCVKLFVPGSHLWAEAYSFNVVTGEPVDTFIVEEQLHCNFDSIQTPYDYCDCPPPGPGACALHEPDECSQRLGFEDDLPAHTARLYWIPRS